MSFILLHFHLYFWCSFMCFQSSFMFISFLFMLSYVPLAYGWCCFNPPSIIVGGAVVFPLRFLHTYTLTRTHTLIDTPAHTHTYTYLNTIPSNTLFVPRVHSTTNTPHHVCVYRVIGVAMGSTRSLAAASAAYKHSLIWIQKPTPQRRQTRRRGNGCLASGQQHSTSL